MNAVSLHSTVNHIGQIIGPAAAGGIIELAGIGTPLMVKTVLAMTLRANSVVSDSFTACIELEVPDILGARRLPQRLP